MGRDRRQMKKFINGCDTVHDSILRFWHWKQLLGRNIIHIHIRFQLCESLFPLIDEGEQETAKRRHKRSWKLTGHHYTTSNFLIKFLRSRAALVGDCCKIVSDSWWFTFFVLASDVAIFAPLTITVNTISLSEVNHATNAKNAYHAQRIIFNVYLKQQDTILTSSEIQSDV